MREDNERNTATLRNLLEEGEQSGTAEYSYESFMSELDDEFNGMGTLTLKQVIPEHYPHVLLPANCATK